MIILILKKKARRLNAAVLQCMTPEVHSKIKQLHEEHFLLMYITDRHAPPGHHCAPSSGYTKFATFLSDMSLAVISGFFPISSKVSDPHDIVTCIIQVIFTIPGSCEG